MDRALKDNPLTLERKVYNDAGVLVNIDSGNMTVNIFDGGGTQIVTNGVAGATATGVYQYSVSPTLTATLDKYEVRWTWLQGGFNRKATSWYEVVGGHYFSIQELRDFDQGITSTQASNQKITNEREKVEELIEKITGRAWVPRGSRETLSGNGLHELSLDVLNVRSLVSVKVTDSGGVVDTFDATELADLVTDLGYIRRKSLGTWLSGYGNVAIHYTHGEDQPPEELKEAAMILARNKILLTNVPDRVLSHSDESGTTQFATAGRRFPTGYPTVDAILERYSDNRVGIA